MGRGEAAPKSCFQKYRGKALIPHSRVTGRGVTQTAVPAPLTRAEFPEGRAGKTGLGRRQRTQRVSFRVSCMISLQDRRCQDSA